MKKYKNKNNEEQDTTHRAKGWATRTPLKTVVS